MLRRLRTKDLLRKEDDKIVDGAVKLFIKNGYSKTTTRLLAKETGLSIGSLYEYVASRRMFFIWFVSAIREEVEQGLTEATARVRTFESPQVLREIIRKFLHPAAV